MPLKKHSKLSLAFLYDDTLDNDAGVAQYVKNVGGWLSRQGHSVSYLVGQSKTTQWDGGRVYSLAKNMPVRWGGNRLSVSFFPKLGDIDSVLKSNHFDVVHVMVPYSPFMSQFVIERLPEKTALVGSFHIFPANWSGAAGSRLLKLVYGSSLKRFDKFLSVSEAAQMYGQKDFGVDSIVSPNVVNISAIQPPPGYSRSRGSHIVFLGRLVERKGCRWLIEAFALVKQQVPDARLTIAGDGPVRGKLEKLAVKLGVDKDVKFLGYIDEADKPALLASADVACFPSLYGECFGIVLIEAMAAGASIVIGGDNPGYRSVLGDKPELLVKPKQTGQFADRLVKYLTDAKAIKQLHDWQIEHVKRYDIEKVGPQLLDTYHEVIAKRTLTKA